MIQPVDGQRARAVTPDQSVACYAARDGLIKISPAGRRYGRVHQLKARLPGFEPRLRRGRGHISTSSRRCGQCRPATSPSTAIGRSVSRRTRTTSPYRPAPLQAHRIEQPADVRDGTGPGRSAPARTAPPGRQHGQRPRRRRPPDPRPRPRRPHRCGDAGGPVDHEPVGSLEAAELTILTCWAEAVAETLAASPDQLSTILDDARAGAVRRRQFGVGEPSADLASALEDLARIVASGIPTAERCWPQRMSVQAAATTATWCEPSFAQSSAGAGPVAEMAPSVRGLS
jgi:hypothetical protein